MAKLDEPLGVSLSGRPARAPLTETRFQASGLPSALDQQLADVTAPPLRSGCWRCQIPARPTS